MAYIPIEKYVDKSIDILNTNECKHIKHILICSDRLSAITEFNNLLKKKSSNLEVLYVLNGSLYSMNNNKHSVKEKYEITNTGYDQSTLNKKNCEFKKGFVDNLIDEVCYMINSDFFIGTFTSGVDRFIALGRKSLDKCYSLDVQWHESLVNP